MAATSIMIVGVGGQGTLLASKILGRLMTDEGYDVKVSEVHGMSQRGGSVVTYVRFGDKVYSPSSTRAKQITSFPLRRSRPPGTFPASKRAARSSSTPRRSTPCRSSPEPRSTPRESWIH